MIQKTIKNNNLLEIKRLIKDFNYTKNLKSRYENDINKMKCEKGDDYETEYFEISDKYYSLIRLIEKEINNYINYPKKKFLFLDFTKKAKIKQRGLGLAIIIPFIDKREYYCTLCLLDSMPNDCRRFLDDYFLI